MVGHHHVLVAQRLSRHSHLLDSGASVRPGGVHVAVALEQFPNRCALTNRDPRSEIELVEVLGRRVHDSGRYHRSRAVPDAVEIGERPGLDAPAELIGRH